jgi:hypothetical protein
MYTLFSLLGSGGIVAVVSFFYTLGNRVAKLETKQEDLPTLIEAKFDAVEMRLDRIERSLNGALLKH